VGGLSLHATVWGQKHRGHQTEGAVSLRNDIRLHITVVVLARPYEASIALNSVGHHVINQSVFIPELTFLELCLIVLVVDLLEDVFESTIVLLQDGVLGRQVQRVVALDGKLEGAMGKLLDGLVRVIHTQQYTRAFELEDLHCLSFACLVVWLKRDEEFARLLYNVISGPVLVAEGMSANDDGFSPAWHKSWNCLDNDGLTKDCAPKFISNRAVRGLPHLLELELSNAGLIRGNRRALYTNFAFLNCFCSIEGNLVIRLVSVLHA
jgi:hypothetical protein